MTKGTRNEKNCADAYQNAGYETYRPETSKYGQNDVFSADDFGGFDILAFKPGEMRGIQVKTNKALGVTEWTEKARKFESVTGFYVDFAVRYDYEGWRVLRPSDDGFTTVCDTRESDGKMGEELTEFLSE